jgi:transcriptional regulator with XRE-family HTH domain
MIVKSDFAKSLKDYRKFFEVTQAEVASAVGVSKRTIEYWEHGERTPAPLFRSEILRAVSIAGYRKHPPEYFKRKSQRISEAHAEQIEANQRRLKPTRKPRIGGTEE